MNFQYSIIYTISIILEILIFGLVVSLSPPFVSLHFSSVGSYLRPPCLVSLLTRSVSSSRFVITSFFLPSPYETSGEEGRRSE